VSLKVGPLKKEDLTEIRWGLGKKEILNGSGRIEEEIFQIWVYS